ncbi:helix-turn-helix domain-containing protein [Ovoidimarina sediminis]|uniref:helix-turn-helix domain-containing protein n=1 Tax=Ovoidimarina sediminis TaxID=3079856 RepID=UPI00290C3173|nr:cupin domain-containing protein [Rhodophyticola sp. MJ-SS7]MDU8945764.1 cupin domain-containing protein [Rhodophyticola sp. MJ-SS7]
MTGEPTVVAMTDSLMSLGAEVRQLRKARGMTLKRLSALAGISLSHLSAIERGASNPSVEVLGAIAAGLDVTPDWFFARRPGAGPMERAFVVRGQNRRSLNTLYGQGVGELGYSDSLLSSSIGGGFYMGLAVYEPNSSGLSSPLHEHRGEEHGFVLEGELEMRIGEETVTLRAGDSYSFDARIPHQARNRTDRVCKLVWAVSPVVIPKQVAQGGTRSDETGT